MADPYLDRLRAIQAETIGVDARISALEAGWALDGSEVDRMLASLIPDRPATYADFLTEAEVAEVSLRYARTINKGVDLDALDYALAAACGVLAGLLDALLVSAPGEGAVASAADNAFDAVVMRFAKSQGWNPQEGNESRVDLAIKALEARFKVGYDQAKDSDAGGLVPGMMPKNHHAMSAAHYPDLIGLVASICNQFTDTSTFFSSGGKGIVIVESAGGGVELRGASVPAKVLSGFANWLGHCMSDVAGSGGTREKEGARGMGLPLPFFELLELCNFSALPGGDGQWLSVCEVMTEVYEDGYDLRHGAATGLPMEVSDLMVRATYALKRRYAQGLSWKECVPGGDSPELQRMATVGIGSMCLVDLAHAAATSWGNWALFFGKLNVAGWARFGMQGARELELVATRENRNILAAGDEISEEWGRLLERSQALLEG